MPGIHNGIGTTFRSAAFGGGAAPTFVPFFDTFANGLDGWSLDRLVTGYAAPILTIVRPSDSATQDIYLDGNSIDTAAILTFVGSENAQVKTIYGQLGYKNLEQLTLASQPLIAKAGVIITDGGKPAIEFDGVDDKMVVTAGYSIDLPQMSALMVSRSLETGSTPFMSYCLGEGGGRQVYVESSLYASAGNKSYSYTLTSLYQDAINNARNLIDIFINGVDAQFGLDGSNVGITKSATPNFTSQLSVGNWVSGTTYASNIKFQELIMFNNADRTSERTAMRDNVNSRYTIY